MNHYLPANKTLHHGSFLTFALASGHLERKSFVTLTSAGPKDPEVQPTLFQSPEAAWDAYDEQFRLFTMDWPDASCIHWRFLPQLQFTEGLWFVYSRLLCDARQPQEMGAAWKPPTDMDIPTNTIEPNVPGAVGWRGPKGPHAGNRSGFRATGHRILLLADPVEQKTESGIILQAKTVQAEENLAVWATVVEVGPDAWVDKSADYCQVGDRVLVGQYTGKFHDSPVDGKRYRFVNDLDIITPLVTVPAEG